MKKLFVVGIIVSACLIIFGAAYPVPEKEIDVYYLVNNPQWHDQWGAEYVGGDAYNYQIEATLKAGYMSGVLTMKSVCFCSGFILLAIAVGMYGNAKIKLKQTEYIKAISENRNNENTVSENHDTEKTEE